MKASDVVKILVLTAEVIDILGKYKGTQVTKVIRDIARKHGISFRQLWNRIPSKWK
jgi:DNA polymerase II small subunit/DNA polymerase delta subunit B